MGIRANILANIATELDEIADVKVVRWVREPEIKWVKSKWGTDTYLAVVVDGREDSEVDEKGTREYLNKMEVQINGYTNDETDPSGTLNALLHNVKAKMEEDPQRGGNAYETSRLRMEIIPELEHPHAGFRLFYLIRYEE